MSKYAMLDDRIVSVLGKRPESFAMLLRREDVCGLANALSPLNASGDATGWRLLERRLAFLRKKNRIQHRDGYWRTVKGCEK